MITEAWSQVPETQKPFMRYLMEKRLFIRYASYPEIRYHAQLVARRVRNGKVILRCLATLKSNESELNSLFFRTYSEMRTNCDDFIEETLCNVNHS